MFSPLVELACVFVPFQLGWRRLRFRQGLLRGLVLAAVLPAASLTMPTASAASITKADNTTALNDTASWAGGVVPGSGDVAVWDSTVTSANTVALGADLDWQGIQVLDPAGTVTISTGSTLSLGSSGIDLSTASADLTVEAGIALTANQAWQAAPGRTITLAGDIAGSADVLIGVIGAGTTSNTFLTTTPQTLFPNATLSTLASASGVMQGAYVGGAGGAQIPGLGYLLNNDGTTANYWLEVLDGGYTKGVKIELAQSGSDITVRAADAKYVSGSQLGYDFNTGGNQGQVATSPTANGYGAASTTLSFASGSGTTRITGNPTYTGGTTIAAGTLDLASATDVTLSGAVSGGGNLLKSGSGRTTLSAAGSLFGTATIEAGTLVLGTNTSLGTAAITLDGGTLERDVAGAVVANDIAVAAGGGTIFGRQTVDDYTAFSGSLSGSGALTADGLVMLSGSGTYSGAITIVGGQSFLRFASNDAVAPTVSITTADASLLRVDGGYSVEVGSLTGDAEVFVSDVGTGQIGRLAVNSGAFAGTLSNGNGSFIFEKTGSGTLTLNRASAAGVITGVEVTSGTLELAGTGRAFNSTGYFGVDQAVSVSSGATLLVSENFNANRTQVTLDGGTLNVTAGTATDSNNYITSVTLRDGATVTGNALRFGYLDNGTVTVAGSSPSTIDADVGVVNGSGYTATFNVGDVSGDDATDLTITGGIRTIAVAGTPVIKSGAGTMLISGGGTFSGPVTVAEGILKVGNVLGLGTANAAASKVTVNAGATFDINGVASGGEFYYGFTLAGSGTSGQGALINSGANANTGARQTPNITLAADASVGGTGTIYMIDQAYGANTLDLAGNTLTKTGTNTFFLNNTTATAGTIDIQQGTVSQFNAGSNASAAAVTLADAAGATLALNNQSLSVGSLAGGGATGGTVTLGSATLTLGGRNEDTSFAGAISGTGAVVKTGTGTQTFAAANTYSGGTTISGGTLLAGVADAFGTTGTLTVEAGGTLGVGAGVNFTRAFTLNTGGKVWLGDNATIALPDAAALAAWESSNTAGGDGTVAEILYGSGATTPSALTSAWTANPGDYFSDILTLEGTGTGNTYVLSMEYSGSFGDMNIWYRATPSDPFAPLGTSFQGDTAWNSGFTTVGQYGIDSATSTVWAVTDHNSQFVVVPEPGTLGLSAMCLAGGIWYLRRRRA